VTNYKGNPIKLPVSCDYGGVGTVPMWQDADGHYIPLENLIAFINQPQRTPPFSKDSATE
jgi:hypothetical protein